MNSLKRAVMIGGALLLLAASGCAHRKNAKAFEKAFEGANGVGIELVKLHTETGGYAVYRNQATGEYFAVNVDKFDRKNGMTYEQFVSIAVPGIDIVNSLQQFSETRSYQVQHTEWVSTGGYWEYDYDTDSDYYVETGYYDTYYTTEYYTYVWYEGNGFRFETGTSASKDLESIAAGAADASKGLLADAISMRYGLSEDRSLQLANLAVAWNKIENSREMTDADKAVFSKEALGADLGQFEKAIESKAKGDQSQYQSLIQKAAKLNGTSPERAEQILSDLFADAS